MKPAALLSLLAIISPCALFAAETPPDLTRTPLSEKEQKQDQHLGPTGLRGWPHIPEIREKLGNQATEPIEKIQADPKTRDLIPLEQALRHQR